jgi:uncharacterized repeat protein (TIGR02543 family)
MKYTKPKKILAMFLTLAMVYGMIGVGSADDSSQSREESRENRTQLREEALQLQQQGRIGIADVGELVEDITEFGIMNADPVHNNAYYIRNLQTGFVLNVHNGNTAGGTVVNQLAFNAVASQQWRLQSPSLGIALAPEHITNRRLTITSNQSGIIDLSSNFLASQQFQLVTHNNRTYSIRQGNRALDAVDTISGTQVDMWTYGSSADLPWQQWYFIPTNQAVRITLNAQGGTGVPSATVARRDPNNTTNSRIGILPTPTRANYRFDGWFTATTGGNPVLDTWVVTGATTLHARWTCINHTFQWVSVRAATCDTRGLEREECSRGGCNVTRNTRETPFNYNNHVKWGAWQNEGCTQRSICGGWDCGVSQFINGDHTYNANNICTRPVGATTCGWVRNSNSGFRYMFRGTSPPRGVSSLYGHRNREPDTTMSIDHTGVDMPTSGNPSVFSVRAGTVRWGGTVSGASAVGHYVVVELTGTGSLNPRSLNNTINLRAGYAHLHATADNNGNITSTSIPTTIRTGVQVTANDVVGKSGTTGGTKGLPNSVGLHLCFRIMTGANSIVPLTANNTHYTDSINPLQFFSNVNFSLPSLGNHTTGTRAERLGAFRRFHPNTTQLEAGTATGFQFIPHPQ